LGLRIVVIIFATVAFAVSLISPQLTPDIPEEPEIPTWPPRSAIARSVPIAWSFRTYTEPNFTSEPVASFSPQNVNVYFFSDDGWAFIGTTHGDVWVYLNENKRFIDRTMVLYESLRGEPTDIFIRPQVVDVLDQYWNWLQITTWYGPMWLDLGFRAPTTELHELLSPFGDTISVYFENLNTGFIYRYNPTPTYVSSSIIQAPLALYMLQLVEQGYTSLDNAYTYLSEDFQEGSGIIQHRYSYGARFTLREILRLSVSYSDSIAANILIRNYNIHRFRQFIRDIGATPLFANDNIHSSRLNVDDAAIFAREIFNYIESGNEYSEELKSFLLDNQSPLITSDYPVASMTGTIYPSNWHDMAIVYAQTPYTLIIFSNRPEWANDNVRTQDFQEISRAFQAFNARWFPPIPAHLITEATEDEEI